MPLSVSEVALVLKYCDGGGQTNMPLSVSEVALVLKYCNGGGQANNCCEVKLGYCIRLPTWIHYKFGFDLGKSYSSPENKNKERLIFCLYAATSAISAISVSASWTVCHSLR